MAVVKGAVENFLRVRRVTASRDFRSGRLLCLLGVRLSTDNLIDKLCIEAAAGPPLPCLRADAEPPGEGRARVSKCAATGHFPQGKSGPTARAASSVQAPDPLAYR